MSSTWSTTPNKRKVEILATVISLVIIAATAYDCGSGRVEFRDKTVTSYVFPEDYDVIQHERDDYKLLSEELQDTVNDLRKQGAKIVTVTQIKTVVEGGETVYVVLPQEHVFTLANGLPVAHFEADKDYTFTTYDLTFQADIVVTDKETGVKFTAKSSAGDEVYQIPVDSVVTFVEPPVKTSVFRPQIALVGGVSFPYTGPEVGVAVPLLVGPKDTVSWLAPMVTVSDTVKVGVAPVMFNVGKPIPLIDDLWVAPAYQSNFLEHYGTLVIGTKL